MIETVLESATFLFTWRDYLCREGEKDWTEYKLTSEHATRIDSTGMHGRDLLFTVYIGTRILYRGWDEKIAREEYTSQVEERKSWKIEDEFDENKWVDEEELFVKSKL